MKNWLENIREDMRIIFTAETEITAGAGCCYIDCNGTCLLRYTYAYKMSI